MAITKLSRRIKWLQSACGQSEGTSCISILGDMKSMYMLLVFQTVFLVVSTTMQDHQPCPMTEMKLGLVEMCPGSVIRHCGLERLNLFRRLLLKEHSHSFQFPERPPVDTPMQAVYDTNTASITAHTLLRAQTTQGGRTVTSIIGVTLGIHLVRRRCKFGERTGVFGNRFRDGDDHPYARCLILVRSLN